MILDIITFPAKSLRKKSQPVAEITDEIRELIENMIETLYEQRGYGLAAPQVGKLLRILVLDETGSEGPKDPKVYINPEIIEASGEIIAEEGCISLPGEYATVARFANLKVRAMNEKGKNFTVDAEGQLARILQHETDHLDGTLFIDKLPIFKRDMIKKHIKRRIQDGDYTVCDKG